MFLPAPCRQSAAAAPLLLLAAAAVCSPAGAQEDGEARAVDALTATCIACHGTDGNSPSGAFPSIAGQGRRYLFAQLQAMRDGDRVVPLMVGQLDGMSDEELRVIAAWYSDNEAQIGQATEASLERGRTLYRFGDLARGIPACSACHGPGGEGLPSAGMPSLTGQHGEYLALSLREYRNGKRASLISQAMEDIAARLSDRDIEALADFIQGLY